MHRRMCYFQLAGQEVPCHEEKRRYAGGAERNCSCLVKARVWDMMCVI